MNEMTAYIVGGTVLIVAVCIVVRFCTANASDSFTSTCQGIALIVLVLLLSTMSSLLENTRTGVDTPNAEQFSNFEWGYSGTEQQQWNPEHSSTIVGPDPDKTELRTWQYNPDNTQVDYRYYRVQQCDAKNQNTSQPQRLAPVARPTLGIVAPESVQYPTPQYQW
jgi:hypothetical protein